LSNARSPLGRNNSLQGATEAVLQKDNSAAPGAATWTTREAYLLALVCLLVGILIGYLFHGSSAPAPGSAGPTTPAETAPAAMPPAGGPTHSAEALQPIAAPLLMAIKADPKNVQALVELGNLYYDNHVYPQAIEYYTRALELKPDDVGVRTDLGTAYWYSGFADKAVAEYAKSLKLQPTHAQTLFNLGIVRMDGLNDPAGAIAAWEKLLATNPTYPEKDRVLALIAQAKQQNR
jgi:cytochrome c-type biogenesis protein CcmH/NrfG